MIGIEGKPDLVRDPTSNAVLSVDRTAYERHRLKTQRNASVEARINSLRDEVAEMKTFLSAILEKLNNG